MPLKDILSDSQLPRGGCEPHHTEPQGNSRVGVETEGARGQCGQEPLFRGKEWESEGKEI